MQHTSETIHASTVAIGARAVMIGGPSGAGKSDLALRLVDRGATLVSDDYTLVTRVGDRLLASAPATIAGRMEVRGIGLVDVAHVGNVPVALCVDLTDSVERMPEEPATRSVAGVAIPLMRLIAAEASAPIKVELGLARWGLEP